VAPQRVQIRQRFARRYFLGRLPGGLQLLHAIARWYSSHAISLRGFGNIGEGNLRRRPQYALGIKYARETENKGVMVRKGGFEPPRLSAPPPQDGVSANSTTSALCKLPVINSLASSSRKGISKLHRILQRLLALEAVLRPLQVRQVHKQFVHRSFPWVYASHRGLNVIVSCNILQRKGIRILSCLS
jgi:hypothetical protein